jgi:hypothetical protein
MQFSQPPTTSSILGPYILNTCSQIPLVHVQPRSSPLPRVCTVPCASAIFKCILEVVFYEGVHQRLQLCLSVLSSIGETEKSRMGVFGKKNPLKRKCETVRFHDARASSFFRQSLWRSLGTFSFSRHETSQ